MKHQLPPVSARNYPEEARSHYIVHGTASQDPFYKFVQGDDHLPTPEDLRQILSDAARMACDISLAYFTKSDWENSELVKKYQAINSDIALAMKALGEFRQIVKS